MENKIESKSESKLLICAIFAAAIIFSAIIISFGLTQISPDQRSVSVRGLSERDVDADTAIWSLGFTCGANDLPSLQKTIVSKNAVVVEFLKEHGLSESDFSILAPEITDTTVNVYMDQRERTYSFIAKQNILIRTGKVQEVKATSCDTLNLLGKGISINSDYDNKVRFIFNGLNAIKPEMIAEATESARQAAEKFASDSHSKVGKIKSATQGLFSIEDAAPGLEEKKHVRVVTTVVYSLAD